MKPTRMRRRNGAPFHHSPQAVTRARESAGLSQKELAKRLGISPSLMCEIEGGRRNAAPDKLRVMAQELGCAVDDLRPRRSGETFTSAQGPQLAAESASVIPLGEPTRTPTSACVAS